MNPTSNSPEHPLLVLRDRTLRAPYRAFIMGILNATPDSLWEGSRAGGVEAGLEAALRMESEGADIIDIGGESTRPGASYIESEEEIRRVVPLVEAIRRHSSIPLSIDTRKASVLKAAVEAGADILNDISALSDDPAIGSLAATLSIPVILMHKQGLPETMQDNPLYVDPVAEVRAYLVSRAEYAQRAGIRADRIILDPGIGFGKAQSHNLDLISGLAKIADAGYPVMMALSRKSYIGTITGRPPQGRLAGTLAANLLSVLRGATYLRVHDVGETRDTLAVLQEIGTGGSI